MLPGHDQNHVNVCVKFTTGIKFQVLSLVLKEQQWSQWCSGIGWIKTQ